MLLLLLFLLPAVALAAPDEGLRHELDEANALKDGSACDEAVLRYEELIEKLPLNSPLRGLARYNQSVCFEDMGLAEPALIGHAQVADDQSAPLDVRQDARFREALILIALERDPEARRALTKLRRRLADSPGREVSSVYVAWIEVRAGVRDRAARRLADAVPVLEAAHAVEDREGLATHLAVASVAMGDLVAEEALRIRLRGSPDRVRALLSRLGETTDAAQVYYVDAMRREDPTWAAGAALHLGVMFTDSFERLRELRDRLRDKPLPGWSPGESQVLELWLTERLDPTLLKARQALRLCADIPSSTGAANRFSDECERRLGIPPL